MSITLTPNKTPLRHDFYLNSTPLRGSESISNLDLINKRKDVNKEIYYKTTSKTGRIQGDMSPDPYSPALHKMKVIDNYNYFNIYIGFNIQGPSPKPRQKLCHI